MASASDRKNIGVLASQVGRAWGAEFIAGLSAAAEANNANLVHFIGGKIGPQITTDSKPSFGLNDLVKPDQFAGLDRIGDGIVVPFQTVAARAHVDH